MTEKRVVIDGKEHIVQVLPYIPPNEPEITWASPKPKPRLKDGRAGIYDYIQTKLDQS